MSNVTSGGERPRAAVFETLLSSPGMGEKSKISLQLSRQNMIVLVHLLEAGILWCNQEASDAIMTAVPAGTLEEISNLQQEILQKGGLTEFYQKLKLLLAD